MSAHAGGGRSERLFQAAAGRLWRWVSRPWCILLPAIALTVAGTALSSRLRIDTDLANLLPPDHPSVVAIERLRATVGSETTAAVIVECPETAPMLAFAERLIPRVLGLRQANGEPFVLSVEFRRDVAFLERSALYLATPAELATVEAYLDEQIEKARTEANPMLVDLLDEGGDGGGETAREKELRRVRRDLIPREYPLSDDGTTLVLKVHLTGSKTDLGFVDGVYEGLARAVAAVDPKRFHPGMSVELGGPLLRHRMEIHAIGRDVFGSVAAGILLVLLTVTAYFFSRAYRVRAGTAPRLRIILSELVRTPAAALVIGVPLGMSLTWTFGVTYLRFGALNLMTSSLALVLFGLGIDFGIHVYARYTEERALGLPVDTAMERTLRASLEPITITTATTAVSFGILMIADFRGFSEFGFISALGIFAALVSMLAVLPALVLFLERTGLLHLDAVGARTVDPGGGRVPFARVTAVLGFAALVATAVLAPRIGFEWNFDRLEPSFPEYDRLREKYYRVYPPGGRNPAYVIAATAAQVPAIVAAVRERAAADVESPTVDRVESLQERFPLDPGAQREKLARIATIRGRLENRWLRRAASEDLDILRRAAEIREPLAPADLPEHLRLAFTDRQGRIGNFVMIYPSVGLSDGRKSIAFADDVGTVTTSGGRVYHAASTSIVAAEMLRLMRADAPLMIGLTVAGQLLLIPFAFRRLGLAALALTPLAAGFGWMLAAAVAWGMSLNFYNMVVLPTVIGMGEDAGVHLVHRWLEEGRGSVRRVIESTGEAVTVCAITAMLGFSGMATSFHPGLRSMGLLAVLGLGCSLAASVVFLPALLQVLEDFSGLGAQRRKPGGRGCAG